VTSNPAEAAKGGSLRAVIDIGTNAVKMLVGRVSAGDIVPICEDNEQTRLGRGLYQDQILRQDSIEATIQAVSRFTRRAREQGAESVRVIATSAVREARNADLLVQAITRATGLKVEVISGDTEARLAFQGVTAHSQLGAGPMLILDAGGGSTEFILGHGERCDFSQSFPLGAVRMLEGFPHSDPPGLAAREVCLRQTTTFLKTRVYPVLDPFLRETPPKFLVGTGGSAVILARIDRRLAQFDREQIEAVQLTRNQVTQQVTRLWESTLEERRKMPGLPPERADIIIMGGIIYQAVMETFGLEELRVSTRGLRFAALLGLGT
jgi:exopolyphosphatase/guanosine-5'-triphosphate,3'-diphosphate pyrophosphatase